MMSPARWKAERSAKPLVVGLVVTRVIVLVLILANKGTFQDSDVSRFQQIADAPGAPWRSYDVEYMPGEVLLISTVAGPTTETTIIGVAVVAFACDLLIASVLVRVFGSRAGTTYLVLGTPLIVFLYFRLDLVPVLLTAGALAWFERRRWRPSGFAFGVATLIKIWPLVILPIALVRRRIGVLVAATGTLIVGGIGWLIWGGLDAPMQVATFRGATGWEAESVLGTLVWIATGDPIRMEQGAPRVGTIPAWARLFVAAAMITSVTVVWVRARRWPGRLEGAASLAAVSALLIWSPVLSLQYTAWLLVPAAIASTEERSRPIAQLAFAVTLLTGILSLGYGSLSNVPLQIGLLVRNGYLVAVIAWWIWATSRTQLVRNEPSVADPASVNHVSP